MKPRRCKNCQKVLVRRPTELPSAFKRRSHCHNDCRLEREKRLLYVKRKTAKARR